MAVRLRLKRMGRRNAPTYRIVAADPRAPRGGRVLENLGQYDPRNENEDRQVTLDVERAQYWVDQGARASETVASILDRHGIKVPVK